MIKLLHPAILLLPLLCLACSNSGTDNDGVPSTGQLTIAITDGPTESADAVVIAFSSIELQGPERQTIALTEAQTVNLLDFQGDKRLELLSDVMLPSGEYQWLRLGIDPDNTYIEIAGEQFPLDIPSSAQTGLKLNNGFTLAAGGVTDFTIDFDLRKSIHVDGNGEYTMRPVLRIVDSLEASTVFGSVHSSYIDNEACSNGDNNEQGNVVYLFTGADANILDIQGTEGDPIASANVVYNATTEAYEFSIGYVAVDDYTIAFTCDATLDMNTEDNSDVVVFSDGQNVTVLAGVDVQVDFELISQ